MAKYWKQTTYNRTDVPYGTVRVVPQSTIECLAVKMLVTSPSPFISMLVSCLDVCSFQANNIYSRNSLMSNFKRTRGVNIIPAHKLKINITFNYIIISYYFFK